MSEAGPRVFVTRRVSEAGLSLLREAGLEVEIGESDEERGLERARLLEGVGRADVLLPLITDRVDREVLEANPRLRGVANYAVGFDNVDVVAATELGIPVSNTPGVLTESTADFTWALLLAVARRVPEAHAYVAGGRWRIWGPNLFLGADPSPGGTGRRKVLGIVGFGRIGQAVARRAAGFDMEVLAHDPPNRPAVEASPLATWASLEELLERSDFVSLHPALTPATSGMIGEAELGRMKPTAYLVNVSRGSIVVEEALARALREGWIAGAALDVFEREPAISPELRGLSNVVLAPHMASGSRDTRDQMAVMAATDALHHLRGEPAPHTLNGEVYRSEAWRRRTARGGEATR